MATLLATPITISQGAMSATATHEHFGMTGQRWSDPPLVSYRVHGIQNADGSFTALTGKRADTSNATPENAAWNRAEYDAWFAKADEAGAFSRLAQMHNWIFAGRPAESKPAWLP